MTDFSQTLQPDTGQAARTIHVLDKASFDEWYKQQGEAVRQFVDAYNFTANPEAYLILPPIGNDAAAGEGFSVVAGVRNRDALASWDLAQLGFRLPEGAYRLEGAEAGRDAMFGWAVAQHQFSAYKKPETNKGPRTLLVTKPADIDAAIALADATAMVRDLVDTPAADMGPDRLEALSEDLAKAHKAEFAVTRGDALETGYPMIHGVGKAAMRAHAPRLIELEWGNPAHPRIAIVGKGVSFDSGGLSMKTADGMLLMKKDMGGAAHAMALAKLIMQAQLPVRLHLLVPAVENAIDGRAVRPGDILNSRKGLTVEITNTDAEGRLILGDALAKAVEGEPEMILEFATLTGAARVALGGDLPALFVNDDTLAADLLSAGEQVGDPAWRMPLWSDYAAMLKSPIADMVNSAAGGMAGCITAALFLQKFVPAKLPWAHFDTYSWRATAKPGRPRGGEALGLRASWAMLQKRYGK